jgi:signal peptidase I
VALPELPDDRRAQPRRYGPADAPGAPRPPDGPWRPPHGAGPYVPPRVGPPVGRPPGPPPALRRPAPPPADEPPTDVVPHVLPAEDAPADRPTGKRRRQLGSSPDERPASSFRVPSSDGRASRGRRRRRPTFWRELPILIVVALVLTFLIQTFLAKVYVIPSGSMETTLHGCTGCNNDRVLVDKVTYRFSKPQPGDVVVFEGPAGWRNTEFSVEETANPLLRLLQQFGSLVGLAPPDEKDFVKRVIAVGGQTVQCCDPSNRVLVDGHPLDEPYIYYLPDAGTPRQAPFGPVTIPDGQLWMMGDSRNNSADSRIPGHGPVPIANVIGRARLIVMPVNRFGTIAAVDPQPVALGGADGATAPVALGLLGVVPLALRRRRAHTFLPPPARRRRRT